MRLFLRDSLLRGCESGRAPPLGSPRRGAGLEQAAEIRQFIMGNRLYIGNLSYDATQDSLRDAFSQSGTVTDVRVMTDRETGRSRGFAFVTMSTSDEATSAIAQMNGALLDGRALRVNEAEDRPAGGGGGGGGRFRR